MADTRAISATTPLDAETLKFGQMEGSDTISRCFEYFLTLVSEDVDIEAKDVLGKPMAVHVGRDGPVRHFHGVVTEFALADLKDGRAHYRATLRPWLWFLSRTTDNRIFQNLSVIEIIEQLLSAVPDLDYDKRLQKSYPPRVYCVQYGESDMHFIQRLLEHEGIFYFFEHREDGHVLVLCDDSAQLGPVPGFETVEWSADTTLSFRDGDFILDWSPSSAVTIGSYVQTDYDFEKPSADLMSKSESPLSHDQDGSEMYHYPGTYVELERGEALSAVRREEAQAPHCRIAARGTVRGLWSGAAFQLDLFPRAAENTDHIVLRASYRMWDDQYGAGIDREEVGFEIALTLAPQAIPFRPERRTRRPRMKGPQTARVVGPAGAEIHTDAYSRVKVMFPWDREGAGDENTSCWVRVSSAWAGSGWGFIQIPRIGQEVIVDFLEGDPDQPIITGRVYNAEQMPPYPLPGEATKSGWKSNSSKGGGGWNEFMFEDKKGSELVYFQAEKDHDELVKNNETRRIGNDFEEDVVRNARQWVGGWREETVDLDKKTHVKQNRTVNIDLNDTETVGVDRALTVGGDETIEVKGDSSETIRGFHTQIVWGGFQNIGVVGFRTDKVGGYEARTVVGFNTQSVGGYRQVTVGGYQKHLVKGNDVTNIKGNQTLQVTKNHSTKVDGDQSLTLKGNQSFNITGGRLVKVAKGQTHDVTEDVWIKAGKKMMLEAADELTLKCGDASIVLKKDGTMTLQGKDIKVLGSGDITIKADGKLTQKGSTIHDN